MIEFSKIKKVTIKEGIVKKITNSSGVVLWKAVSDTSGDTSSVTVDLNNQWVESTKKLDGYLVYMSNSNKGVGNGYASMKFKFKGKPDFKIWINSYAESPYDFTIAFNMDVDYPTSNPDNSSTGVKLHTEFFQKDPTTIDNFKEVDYPNDGGEHFVVVTYRKNGYGDMYDDRGYVAIKLKPLSTSWVLSSTEFIKENDKYYQRINEIATYEGGYTGTTGNYKKGNELTPTYIQSDANDYILVGSSMYYKKYAWITPVDTAINTGDYIQGDYIGETTPSMKVTYTDNTEKTFYNLTSIERDTIPNKLNAKTVEIYDGVTSIGEASFYVCTHLTSVTIPNSVTNIGNQAFDTCTSLTSLVLPDSITSVNFQTFATCSSLTSVTLPDSIIVIGDRGFYESSSLSSINIPSGTTSIGVWAFRYCSSLSSVTIENSSSKLAYNEYAFGSISSSAKLYVPSNLLADYQADAHWTRVFPGGIYAIPKNETVVTYTDGTTKEFNISGEITSGSVENISAATKVDIGNSVTSIGDNSFRGCSGLTSVTIPDSVTSIGDFAFNICPSITSITIPNSVTSIGSSAFSGCKSLKSITIPDSVTSIGDYSFASCGSITSIVIPNLVTSIGNATFVACKSLESVTIKNSSNKLKYSTAAFYNISSSAKLYVPSNLLADYQADTDWTGAFPGGIYAIGS